MSIQNPRQLENTRTKLRELEERLAAFKQSPTSRAGAHARELTRRSFGGLIKQLKEEIARYETQHTQRV